MKRKGDAPLKTICVIQHTEAEYLGLLEDHLESRSIRFQYFRPFTRGGTLPIDEEEYAGLILLGGGPFGVVSGPLVTSMAPELRIAGRFLEAGKPVVGFGIGAILLAVAAGGGAEEAPLRFEVTEARRSNESRLAEMLPEEFPCGAYLRDKPVLPQGAEVLARDPGGGPLVFAIGANSFGFICHPGIKSAMVEDLIMEYDEAPENTAMMLEQLRMEQAGIAEALSTTMIGLVQQCGWMDEAPAG